MNTGEHAGQAEADDPLEGWESPESRHRSRYAWKGEAHRTIGRHTSTPDSTTFAAESEVVAAVLRELVLWFARQVRKESQSRATVRQIAQLQLAVERLQRGEAIAADEDEVDDEDLPQWRRRILAVAARTFEAGVSVSVSEGVTRSGARSLTLTVAGAREFGWSAEERDEKRARFFLALAEECADSARPVIRVKFA